MSRVIYKLRNGNPQEFDCSPEEWELMDKKHPDSFEKVRTETAKEVRTPTVGPVTKVKPAPGAPKVKDQPRAGKQGGKASESKGAGKRNEPKVVRTPVPTTPAAPAPNEGTPAGSSGDAQ